MTPRYAAGFFSLRWPRLEVCNRAPTNSIPRYARASCQAQFFWGTKGLNLVKVAGHPETLYETLVTQLARLPAETRVWPGHEYVACNLEFTLDRELGNEDTAQRLAQARAGGYALAASAHMRGNPPARVPTLQYSYDSSPFVTVDHVHPRNPCLLEASYGKPRLTLYPTPAHALRRTRGDGHAFWVSAVHGGLLHFGSCRLRWWQ